MLRVLIVLQCVLFVASQPPPSPASSCGSGWTGEFLFIQDLSSSFQDDMDTLNTLAETLFTGLNDTFPDAMFSLASFIDKPIAPYGDLSAGDYCYQLHSAMTRNIADLVLNIRRLTVRAGGDLPESQLDALHRGLLLDNVGWTHSEKDEKDRFVLRVAILVTDATFHVAGETSLIPFSGDPNMHCAQYGYPSLAQVKDAFVERNAIPLFLISGDNKSDYQLMVDDIGKGGSVQTLTSDSSNVIEAIAAGLNEITCQVEGSDAPTATATTGNVAGGATAAVSPNTTTSSSSFSDKPTGLAIGLAVSGGIFCVAGVFGLYFAFYKTSAGYRMANDAK
eukprot:Lankesteria_metandrocarpae@DN4854_c0_g1_i4.p1